MRSWRRRLGAGLCAVVLAACGSSGVGRASSLTTSSAPEASTTAAEPGATTTTTTAPTTAGPEPLAEPIVATGDAELDATLSSVARFVEAQRGHPFRTPVAVQLADDATFRQRLLSGFDASAESLRRTERVLKILGLLPSDVDFVELSRKLTGEEVIGFYEPDSKALLVRSATLNAFARLTLAHELTHALDDQWFDLDRPDVEGDDEKSFAFGALVEGSAEWVRRAYLGSMTAAERSEAQSESDAFAAGIDTTGVPIPIIELSESAYSLGLVLVDHLVAAGGAGALDAAFSDPPATSEQVMHPAKYDSREKSLDVAAPDAPGAVVDDGEFGELFIVEMLNASTAPAVARRAGAGWNGDHYVVWTDPSGASCLRDDIATDTVADHDELVTALRSWRLEHSGAEITEPSADRVRLDTCS